MADSAAFDLTATALEAATSFDKLTARGTVRLGLKAAGLDTASVDTRQMLVVLKNVLPEQLERRGVENAVAVCSRIAERLATAGLTGGEADGADRAAAVFARLGDG